MRENCATIHSYFMNLTRNIVNKDTGITPEQRKYDQVTRA